MRAQAVGKRYGRGRWVLEDVTVDVPAGATVAFHGRNGSGKSTLLRLLVGLSRPTLGTITGRPAVVGYVPDRFSPPERLSARGYLTHLGRIRGLATPHARSRADTLLERLALAGGPHAELRTLSKGNGQKVALAQALLVQPELLVLDEPWSGLDASVHHVLAEIMAEVAGAGGSVVFTGHGAAARNAAATRSHLVEHGRLHPFDPESAYEESLFTELVLQHPSRDGDVTSRSESPQDVESPAWTLAPGVLSVTQRGEDLVLAVDRADADAVLLAALQDGWSAESVTRTGKDATPRTAAADHTRPRPEDTTRPTSATSAARSEGGTV